MAARHHRQTCAFAAAACTRAREEKGDVGWASPTTQSSAAGCPPALTAVTSQLLVWAGSGAAHLHVGPFCTIIYVYHKSDSR